MNSDTGKPYRPEEVEDAHARGEKLVPISERAYKNIKAGRDARAHALRVQRRRRDRLAKAARKKSRR